jgi:membrane protease subunit (stomatin/prohibitin family)
MLKKGSFSPWEGERYMAIIDVVKFNGTPDVFAWKFPSEELSTWTQLIVAESQEAVLFKSGMALDVFGPGRHVLETANIPVLNHLIKLPFGRRSPFTAEVWFVNRVHSLDVKWGTTTPIQLQDPKFGIIVPLRSFGQFGIRITDTRKFLLKIVGTVSTVDKDALQRFFRGLYLTKVKDTISSYLVHKQIGALEINAYLAELSQYLSGRIAPILDDYGIGLVNFFVNDISIPEDDPAVIKLKEALAKRAEMDIIGFNYQQERSFDTLEGAAKNPGSSASAMMGAGLGLGMGVGMGGAFGGEMAGIAGNLNTGGRIKCQKCGSMTEEGKRFCSGCGGDLNKPGTAKCHKCGTTLGPHKKFCPECGSRYNPCPDCLADIPQGASRCPGCGYTTPTPCPKCESPVTENTKFCSKCGELLSKKCPKCQLPFSGTPKFCSECGENLTNELT